MLKICCTAKKEDFINLKEGYGVTSDGISGSAPPQRSKSKTSRYPAEAAIRRGEFPSSAKKSGLTPDDQCKTQVKRYFLF